MSRRDGLIVAWHEVPLEFGHFLVRVGYGAFSVSESSVEAVSAYISDQAEHHRIFSYQEELRELLKRHRVAFDETLSLGIVTDPRPPFQGDSSRGRLPRAEAHGLFCFRPSGDLRAA